MSSQLNWQANSRSNEDYIKKKLVKIHQAYLEQAQTVIQKKLTWYGHNKK